MKLKKATQKETREALLKSIQKETEEMMAVKDCLWPEKCKCWDCQSYHPFFSPLIVEDKR